MVKDSPQLSYTPAREEVTGEASPSFTHPRQTPHDRRRAALTDKVDNCESVRE